MLVILFLLFFRPEAHAQRRGSKTVLHPDVPVASNRILVKFRSGTGPGAAKLSTASAPVRAGVVTKQFHQVGWSVVQLEPEASLSDALAWWRQRNEVETAEPDYLIRLYSNPNDPNFPGLWGLRQIHAPDAWSLSLGGSNVVVGIVDSGIDYLHPDLAPNMWRNPGEIPNNGLDDDRNGYIDDVHGIDVADKDADPWDDGGHGSHVAGTVGAAGGNGLGVVGVNWNVQLLALRIFTADGFGGISQAVEAIDYAIALRGRGVPLRVLNHSWGGAFPSLALKEAFTRAGNAGILSVCAAGNERADNDTEPGYPAGYDSPALLSVAASTDEDTIASFSNHGIQTVDLAAPGSQILSTYKGGPFYTSFSGTSMAAPHVAGAAALLFGLRPELSAVEAGQILLSSVDPLPQWRDLVITGGRLNLSKAASQLLAIPPGSPFSPPANPAPPSEPSALSKGHPTPLGPLRLLSRNLEGELGDSITFDAAISGDGRWIAFASDAANLVPGDTNEKSDIFLLNRATLALTRISLSSAGAEGNDHSDSPQISRDGRFVVFASWASNLTPPITDSNNAPDIFLYDRVQKRLLLVSRSRTGRTGNGWSYQPQISADGGAVVFSSEASNLVAGDLNRTDDVFVYSVSSGSLRLVSVNPFDGFADDASSSPSISADGRFVAFHSGAGNLSPVDYIDTYDVFLADLDTGDIELISAGGGGTDPAEGDSLFPSISADGRFVVFQSYATNLVQGMTGAEIHVYRHDRLTRATALISRDGNGRPAGASDFLDAHLGASGRFVVFTSDTSSLDAAPNQESLRLYRYDTAAEHLIQLAFNAAGKPPLLNSFAPRLSDDDRSLVFTSEAFNLLPADGNAADDAFLADWTTFPPDLRARPRGAAEWTGSGIIGSNTAQRLVLDKGPSSRSVLDIEIIHTGFESQSFTVQLSPLPSPWTASVASSTPAASENNAPLNPSGWNTPMLAPGARASYSLEINGPLEHPPIEFLLTVFAPSQPLDRDVLRLVRQGSPDTASPRAVSRRPLDSSPANGPSFSPSASGDGRYIVFASEASNLFPNDRNLDSDIFLFDLTTQTLECLSVTPNGGTGRQRSGSPSISRDGRFVAFDSRAGDLAPGDTNEVTDIFLKDRTTGALTRVTQNTGPNRKSSESPALSADGNTLVYRSIAHPSGSGAGNLTWDIFLFDRIQSNSVPITRLPDGAWANGDSEEAVVTADGKFVAFTSFASNLAPNDTNGFSDVFLFERETGTIELVSRTPDGVPGNGESNSPSLSNDGRWIVFVSSASDLHPSSASDLSGAYLYDRAAKTLRPLSEALGLPAEAEVFGPLLAASGRHLIFNGRNLGPAFPSGPFSQVYAADLTTRAIQWLSRDPEGKPAEQSTSRGLISADGTLAAFSTYASNLVGENLRNASQILVQSLTWDPPATTDPDSDNDGLPDAWELAHFPSLTDARPLEDADSDGHDNRAEFHAGTHPRNAASKLALSGTISGEGMVLTWPSVAGKKYRVERSLQLKQFEPLAPSLLATPPSNRFQDSTPAGIGAAFYRIVIEP